MAVECPKVVKMQKICSKSKGLNRKVQDMLLDRKVCDIGNHCQSEDTIYI